MRLPWIQVDQEAFERAVELAAVLQISEAQAVGHLAWLWRWSLSRPADVQLTGRVTSASAVAQVEAGARWTGPRGALVLALADLGLVDSGPESVRVRGLDRYLKQLERRAQDRERKGKWRNPPTADAEIQRTEHGIPADKMRQTQTQTHITPPSEECVAGAPPPVEPPVALELTPTPPPAQPAPKGKREKATDPRHAPLVETLCAVFLAERGVAYPFGGGRDAKAVSAMLAGAEPGAITEAWRRALRHRGYPAVATLSELQRNLAHFAGTGPPTRAGDARAMTGKGEATTIISEGIS